MPKFKVGDWIRIPVWNHKCQISKVQVLSTDVRYEFEPPARDSYNSLINFFYEQSLLGSTILTLSKKDDSVKHVMVKSMKNEVLMHHRKNHRLDGLEEIQEQAAEESNSLESEESHRLIFDLVNKLPEKQREIFHLREIEELSYEEISIHMEISLDQVKVNLHRARKTLREKLINQGITRS
jgi:hypothetical protein